MSLRGDVFIGKLGINVETFRVKKKSEYVKIGYIELLREK